MRALRFWIVALALVCSAPGLAAAPSSRAAIDARSSRSEAMASDSSNASMAAGVPETAEAKSARAVRRSTRLERARAEHLRAQLAAEQQSDRGPLQDRELIPIRVGLLALAALAFALVRRATARGLVRLRRGSRAGLALLALASIATWYHLFLGDFKHDFDSTDVFHYYVGSKYADELGYFGLYECSLVVLDERGKTRFRPRQHARDLRSMRLERVDVLIDGARDCPDRFGTERWQAFGDDVAWFFDRWSPKIRDDAWRDFGYHPSPVWNTLGGAFSRSIPIESDLARGFLRSLDRVLLAIGFASVFAAFGFEIGCLVVIAWGSGFLWRYGFVGDGFLRHAWWCALFVGVSALRLGRPAMGGAALALSTALRIFPGAAGFGVVAHAALQALRERRAPRGLPAPNEPRAPVGFMRFAVGAAMCGASVVALGLVFDARGAGAYAEFAEKIGTFSGLAATNRIGLSVATTWLFGGTPWLATTVRVVLGLAGLALFAAALRHARAFEAAVLGLILIPFVTDPTNYYYAFLPLAFVFAERRPSVTFVLLAMCVAFNSNGWLSYRTYEEYFQASIIAVIGCGCVLAWMARPERRPELPDAATPLP